MQRFIYRGARAPVSHLPHLHTTPACIQVCYFLALFIMTMRRQIQHMIKHNYVPISLGKPTFKGKDDN